jgi:hypothetical protein
MTMQNAQANGVSHQENVPFPLSTMTSPVKKARPEVATSRFHSRQKHP